MVLTQSLAAMSGLGIVWVEASGAAGVVPSTGPK